MGRFFYIPTYVTKKNLFHIPDFEPILHFFTIFRGLLPEAF